MHHFIVLEYCKNYPNTCNAANGFVCQSLNISPGYQCVCSHYNYIVFNGKCVGKFQSLICIILRVYVDH